MKKQILSLALCSIVMLSCSTENAAVNNVESMKTNEMANFDKALKSLMNPENRSTPEEIAKNGNSTELNERSKDILYLASKKLIISTGITEQELSARTSNSKEMAITMATKLYFEKYNDIQKGIKSEK